MKKIVLYFTIISTVSSFLLFFGFVQKIKAEPACEPAYQMCQASEDPKCKPGDWSSSTSVSEPFRCHNFPVYKCSNNSCGTDGGALAQGIKWYMCTTTYTSGSNGCVFCASSITCEVSGPLGPDQIEDPFTTIPDYHICPVQYNSWGKEYPITECRGKCYPAVTTKSPDDPDLLPKNISDSTGYKLPVNLSWDDLEDIVGEPPSSCKVPTYEFNITSPSLTEFVAGTQLQNTDSSEYKLKCKLKSNTSYTWKTRGCLTQTDCGDWSNTNSVKTSEAPEVYSPYDKDWNGEEGAANTEFSGLTLNWCDFSFKNGTEEELPLSYLLKFYTVKNNEDDCSHFSCEPEVIAVDPRYSNPLDPYYTSDGYTFTKGETYAWEVSACKDIAYEDCTEYSEKWRFSVGDFSISSPGQAFPPNDPTGDSPVGLPVSFQWDSPLGAKSYIFQLTGFAEKKLTSASISYDFPSLSLNKTYTWKVKSCWDAEGEDCEENWSDTYSFKTTGQAPISIYPSGNNISVPTNFQWSEVSGAKFYILKIQGPEINKEIETDKTNFSIEYPDLKQETSYSWQIKTCAKENLCGNYSPETSFTTARLFKPTSLVPLTGSELYSSQRIHILSWAGVAGANFYQYELDLTQLGLEEKNENCKTGNVSEKITNIPNSDTMSLLCLGEYEWKVRACFDQECAQAGDWSEKNTFSIVDKNAEPSYGLVPCGRVYDNPDTTWDERQKCEIKHIFLLIRNIIDFILWKFAPLMIGLLVLGTGLMFFFSIRFQSPIFMKKIKLVWGSAGKGYGLLFLSWTLLNVLLRIIGFKVGIFGEWWKIGF